MPSRPKRPRDTNQLAAMIVALSTGDAQDEDPNAGKDPAAIERGRAGGLRGGKSRAEALSPRKRQQIAKKAAAARWKPKSGK